MTYSEGIKEFGLFAYVNMEIKRKRESMPQAAQWFAAPPTGRGKKRTGKVYVESIAPEIVFKKRIVPATVDAVDDETPEVSEDDPQELSLEEKAVVAGDQEPDAEDQGETEVEVADE